MPLIEIRWHARAGQGAKTAAQALALAAMREGKSVQAFPEYGPERRGAPVRAYTRLADEPIRRHDGIPAPDVVVVLEPSLAAEQDVGEGLKPGGVVLEAPAPRNANLVMLGAVAAHLGEPSLESVQEAAVEELGAKVDAEEIRAAVSEGYAWRR
jgi:Pyruvate/2-oxoacid:ferredoxin oxidoreductase gamma subunit